MSRRDRGTALGIEILAFDKSPIAQINDVLVSLGHALLSPTELAPPARRVSPRRGRIGGSFPPNPFDESRVRVDSTIRVGDDLVTHVDTRSARRQPNTLALVGMGLFVAGYLPGAAAGALSTGNLLLCRYPRIADDGPRML